MLDAYLMQRGIGMLSVLREVHSNDEQTNKKVITIPYGGYGRGMSLGGYRSTWEGESLFEHRRLNREAV